MHSYSVPTVVRISEKVWRTAASNHKSRIQSLLGPGLLQTSNNVSANREDFVVTGRRAGGEKRAREEKRRHVVDQNCVGSSSSSLDPLNPVYNFLIEYYGIKGSKGIRRLTRWSPNPALLFLENSQNDPHKEGILVLNGFTNSTDTLLHSTIYQAAMEVSHGLGGILLENANENDMGGTLHLRGCIPVPMPMNATTATTNLYGILYNPAVYYSHRAQSTLTATGTGTATTDTNLDRQDESMTNHHQTTISQFQWYASILQSTLQSEPILHCHGLHEWAMQYRPPGAPPPPSAKYQANLTLRVSQQVINDAVERKGISCTHVDALRFFAPDAKPLNRPGSEWMRSDQLRLEQKACVHAHMDLLKMAMKLTPFLDADLLGDILEVAIEARKLDIEASPYDATAFGVGIVPVETKEGRKMYRERQRALMERAEPVRKRLLEAYEKFMLLAFDCKFDHVRRDLDDESAMV